MEFGAESDPEMNFNPDYEIASDEEDGIEDNMTENRETKDEEPPIMNDDKSECSTNRSDTSETDTSGSSEEDDDDDDDDASEDDDDIDDDMAEVGEKVAETEGRNSEKDTSSPSLVSHDMNSKSSSEVSPLKERTLKENTSSIDLSKDLSNISPSEKSRKEKDGEPRRSFDSNLDIYADMSMDGSDFKTRTHKMKDGDSNLDLYSEFVIEEVSSRPSYDQLLKDKDINHLKVEELKSSLKKLVKQENAIKEENLMLRKNISSLYKTAKSEINRKDKEIAALIRKLDYLQPMRFQALMYRKIVAARSQGKEGKEFDAIVASTLQAKELSSKNANTSEKIQQLEDSLAREYYFQKDDSQERKRRRDNKDEHEDKLESDRTEKREKRSGSRDKSDRLFRDTKAGLMRGKESLPHKRQSCSPTNDARQRNKGTLPTSPSRKRKDRTNDQYTSSHTNGTVNSHRRKEDARKEQKVSEEPKVKERRTEDKHKQKEHRRDEPSSSSLSSKLSKSERSYETTTKKEKSSLIDKQMSVNKYDTVRSAEGPSRISGRSSSVDSQRHRRDDYGRKSDKEPSKSHIRISSNEPESRRSSSVDRHRTRVKEQEKKGSKDSAKMSDGTSSDKSDQRHRKGSEGRSLDRLSQKDRDRELEIQRRIKKREHFRQMAEDKLPPNRTLSGDRDEGKRFSSSRDNDRQRKSMSQELKPDIDKLRMKEKGKRKEDETTRVNEKGKRKPDETTRGNEKRRLNPDEITRGNEKGRWNPEETTKGNEKGRRNQDDIIRQNEKGRRNQDEIIRQNEKGERKPNETTRKNEKESRERARNGNHSSNDKSHGTKKEKQLQDSQRSQSSTKSSHSDAQEHGLNERKYQKHRSRDAVERTDKKTKRSPVKKVKPHQLPTLRHLEHDDSSSENDTKLISSSSQVSKNRKPSTFSTIVTTTTKKTDTDAHSLVNINATNAEVDEISLSDIDSGSDEDAEYSQTDKSNLEDSKEELVGSMKKRSPEKRPKPDDQHKQSVKVSSDGTPERKQSTIQKKNGEKGSKESKVKESIKHSKNAPKSANIISQGPDKLKATEKEQTISKLSKKKPKNDSETEKTRKDASKERKASFETQKIESDVSAKEGPINIPTQNISDTSIETPPKNKDDRINKKRKRKEKEGTMSKIKVKKIKKNDEKHKDNLDSETPEGPISTEGEKKTADAPIDEKITPEKMPAKEDSQLEDGELSEGEIKSDSESDISPEHFKPTGHHRLGRSDERRREANLGKSKDLRQLINKRDVHKRSKDSYRVDKPPRSRNDRY